MQGDEGIPEEAERWLAEHRAWVDKQIADLDKKGAPMKRKRMGDAGRALLAPRAPAAKQIKATGSALGAVGAKAQPEYVGIMFMLSPVHRDALQAAATELRRTRGGRGRANASEVLRALLDEWIAKGSPVRAGA
jgi:hypothetical protein